MADRRGVPPPTDIERALRDLGTRLDAPTPPSGSVARAVVARLRADLDGDRSPARPPLRDRLAHRLGSRTRLVAILVAGLLLLAGAAVAVGITVGGIALRPAGTPIPATTDPQASPPAGSPTTPSPEDPTPVPLGLGRRVTLEGARAGVGFPVLVPEPGDRFGGIDEVRLSRTVTGGMVSFLYRSDPGLPEVGGSGAGLVITQFGGSVDGAKEFDPARPPVAVDVHGREGFFVEGVHTFLFTDADGRLRLGTRRVVGSTLIWETEDGVVVRIESDLPLARVLPIARSLVPAGN